MTTRLSITEQRAKSVESRSPRAEPNGGEAVRPPSLLSLIRTAFTPKSVLSTLTKEERRELVQRAAESSENSGDDKDI
jgi:hypothetical protein